MAQNRFRLTPSELFKTSQCPHYYFLECFEDASKKQEQSPGQLLLFQKGSEFEKQVAGTISGLIPVDWSRPEWERGFDLTVDMLGKGVPWIYQGVLIRDNFLGNPDLLRRTEEKSKLGNFSYVPVDIKNHKAVSSKDKLQLFCYGFLLEPLLGYRPKKGAIWLNTGKVEEVPFDHKLEKQFFVTLDRMKSIQLNESKTESLRCPICNECLWLDYCETEWERKDDVSLLTGVTGGNVGKLRLAGFATCKDICSGSARVLAQKSGISPETAHMIYAAARARKTNRPILLHEIRFPAKKTIYFYDVETYGDTVYLHGLIKLDKGIRKEEVFFAESLEEANKAWHNLLEYFAGQKNRKPVIYSWTFFELKHIVTCWQKYGGNKEGYTLLSECLVDQKEFVKDHVAFPCRGYSIKDVAPCFGFHWKSADAGGLNCETWYRDYLQSRDPALREKIIEYNLDDVRAMETIDRELKRLFGGKRRG